MTMRSRSRLFVFLLFLSSAALGQSADLDELRCEVASLANGESTELRATKLLTGSGQGTYATITAATPDPNLANNEPFYSIDHISPPAELKGNILFPPAFDADGTLTVRSAPAPRRNSIAASRCRPRRGLNSP